ncbi:sugar phosphate isomerase/epimerase family protein [Alicyclobacillus dauci]|uniref:Sugar phosphate isomerase/epimerase n=1 Tax=Alicyclobacillus dauci TaxID=1475485 RepID=A0ABY6YZM8_9BACL|nr:sugar phosphate isomerase/epimerase family protein [Alicyclobacillus dauci]WAH35571.1 sugar phosphate isomerase/epimerase [Alicyclobacillus dauci]
MHLCVSMWSLHRKFFDDGWTVMDFLEFCSTHDIQHVELLDVFWRDEANEVAKVLEYVHDHEMTVDVYAVTNDCVQSDRSKREQALASVLKGVEMAKKFSAPVVRVFAGDLKEGYDFDSAVGYIVDGFKEATARIQNDNVVLALENHGKLAGRGDQVKRIILDVGSDKLRSTFDVGNFYLVGQQPMEALAELSGYVAHVHAKDFEPSDKGFLATTGEYFAGRECGSGIVPYGDVVNMLRTIRYDASLSLEYEGDGDEIDGVLKSLAFLRSVVDQTTNV